MLAVGACDRAPAPAPASSAFSYAATADVSGYYRPVTPVRVGDWRLDQLFLAQPADFEGQGGASAPITIRFVAANDPAATGGGEAEGRTIRVQPTRYSVTDTAVRFEGRSPELGRVTFDGRLDQGALATARRNLGAEGAVVIGTLTAGGQTAGAVRLSWSLGG